MPSFWSYNHNFGGAPRVPNGRSQSPHSRRAMKLHRRLAHDQDSSITELFVEQEEEDAHCHRHADITTSVGDEATESQFLDDNFDSTKIEIACPDVKVLQYKVENKHLKELLRSRTHDLREKCSALNICQTELAEALISQTTDDNCIKGRQIHKLARGLKERLSHSEMQMKLLQEERDQASLDLATLSGKMTTCTKIAEEQAKLLRGQLDTIRKFEKKIQALEKTLKEMRVQHRQTIHNFESNTQDLQEEHKEKLQYYENSIKDLQAKHKEEIQLLEQGMHDMQVGYKQEQEAIEEQLALHKQRATLQDRKIKKCHHERDVARSQILKGRTREVELEDHLHAQATIHQDTTKELSAAMKEIEQLKNISLELHEQEERMEQLWVDNARLVQLLADNDIYENFVHDMQEGKGLVFCPSNSRFQSLAKRYGAGSSHGPINPKRERDQWIPVELYDLVMAFRKQHCLGLEIEVIQDLLRLVTTFWRERYKKIVYQVKLKHEKQQVDLKRRLTQRLPYEEVVQSTHPRPVTNGAQPTKPLKTRDIECFGSSPTRRLVEDEPFGAQYKAQEGLKTHNPREVPTKYSELSPTRRGRGKKNPKDEHELYSKSGVAWKNQELGKMSNNRQREFGMDSTREVVAQSPQKSKKVSLRRVVVGQWLGEETEKEKLLSAPDRITSNQKKDRYIQRTILSSLESSIDGDIHGPRPRQRLVRAKKDDQDGLRSFSGSSSI